MKRSEIIIIILLVLTWFAEDLYHLAPRKTYLDLFPFAEKTFSIRWYIDLVIIHLKFIIFVSCLMFKKHISHWILHDILTLTILLNIISLTWFVLMYNNPIYKIELYIKFIALFVIWLSIISTRWHASNDDRLHNRGDIHRAI